MGVAVVADGDGVGRAVRRRACAHAFTVTCAHAALPHALYLSITVTGRLKKKVISY